MIASWLKSTSVIEIYVNDAFGTAHRAHSSTRVAIPPAVAGLPMEKELKMMGGPEEPERLCCYFGWPKYRQDHGIETLSDRVDTSSLRRHGFYLLAAQGKGRRSLLEEDKIPVAKDIMTKAKEWCGVATAG